jgi:hypothetical protein
MLDKVQAMLGKRKARGMDELLNISASEQAALDKLAQALDMKNTKTNATAQKIIAA